MLPVFFVQTLIINIGCRFLVLKRFETRGRTGFNCRIGQRVIKVIRCGLSAPQFKLNGHILCRNLFDRFLMIVITVLVHNKNN